MYCHRKFRPLSKPRLATIPIYLKGASDGQTKNLHPEFKATVVLEALRGESLQAKLCQRHNLSEEQLSTWKCQLLENAASLFESTDK